MVQCVCVLRMTVQPWETLCPRYRHPGVFYVGQSPSDGLPPAFAGFSTRMS